MLKHFVIAGLFFAISAPVIALEADLQFTLTFDGDAQRDVLTYQCEGMDDTFRVDYINAHPNFLAIVPVDGEKLIFVNVMSASGARYQAGEYTWWTKGNDADLYSAFKDGDDAQNEPVLSCHTAELIP